MKNNDFSKIIILILLNSSFSAREIKQIVNNPMLNHQLLEIQPIELSFFILMDGNLSKILFIKFKLLTRLIRVNNA